MKSRVKPIRGRARARGPAHDGGAQAAAVTIAQAKGRPMLVWVGKRAPSRLKAFPIQPVELFDPVGDLASSERAAGPRGAGGLLIHADNKDAMSTLIASGYRGRVDLVYIDPPFDTGASYVRRVTLRGKSAGVKLDSAAVSIGEQLQYTDIWSNDNYLQFMYERLLLIRELLSEQGTLYLHADTGRAYLLRHLLDEVFGAEHFMNEVVWQRTTAHADTQNRFGEIHDAILVYRKGDRANWTQLFVQYSQQYLADKYNLVEEGTNRRYRLGDVTAPGPRPNLEYVWKGVRPPPGRCWAVERPEMERYDREGRLVYSKSGMPQYKRYLDEMKGVPLQDLWTDIPPVNPMADERVGYPTQKPEALLERIVAASSLPGQLVLDCFAGSGTTCVVAQKMGRRWIGCDINKGALQVSAKRLQATITRQLGVPANPDDKGGAGSRGFSVVRVNNYELNIPHDEAVALVCDFIGAERTKADQFFDATLGSSLVKIVPFSHALSVADLESIKQELAARPEETRRVSVVCLGRELSAGAWVDTWNRLRKGKDAPNRLEVIELRTDAVYGGFAKYEPARARVTARRLSSGLAEVAIADFISPTIVNRLRQQGGSVVASVTDWRVMVDSVALDTNYDGALFRAVLVDVPSKKTDVVSGKYEVECGRGATIAVKVIDMLGEEVTVIVSPDRGR